MAREYDADFGPAPAGYDPPFRAGPRRGYGRGLSGYGADYERFPGHAALSTEADVRRRWLLARVDRRTRGALGGAGRRGRAGERTERGGGASPREESRVRVWRGYERRQPYPPGERQYGSTPPEYRRYLSEDEYGLGPGRAYDRAFREERFRRGPLGPRNALFGGEGFARYDGDYDEQWW